MKKDKDGNFNIIDIQKINKDIEKIKNNAQQAKKGVHEENKVNSVTQQQQRPEENEHNFSSQKFIDHQKKEMADQKTIEDKISQEVKS